MDIWFFINSFFLGVGLAMDAFSVSIANGLSEPHMKTGRRFKIAGTYAIFQTVMPLVGWGLVRTAAEFFQSFQKFIPWIALILLSTIGGKMLLDGWRARNDTDGGEVEINAKKLSLGILMLQGLATSIDALSVGFTIVDYTVGLAVLAAVIIGAVTLVICLTGLAIGR
ncbi:MAG: manganese efflux pump, partial [Butyrivibrio sp.]|nr:manganese efflux pump [Butyrivibrio sp.]